MWSKENIFRIYLEYIGDKVNFFYTDTKKEIKI